MFSLLQYFGAVLLSVCLQYADADAGQVHINRTERRITLQANEMKEQFSSNMNSFNALVESEMDLLRCQLKDSDFCPRNDKSSSPDDQCPADWHRKGGRCFTVVLDQQSDWSWFKAMQTCAAMDATLMELETTEELEYLANFSKTNNRHLWLGATDWFKEGSWVWLSGKDMTFKWGSGQPSAGTSQNCLGIYIPDPHSVHDFNCGHDKGSKLAPVCKKNVC